MPMMNRRTALVGLALVAAWAGSADRRVLAWGNEGHEIVCAIAYKLLSPPDRQEVDRLARLYRDPDGGRFQYFTRACTFPDIARTRAGSDNPQVAKRWQRFAQFDNWHFLNLPRTDTQVGSGTCADCVLHGITQHKEQLHDHSLPDMQRAEALLFLGHWVGDVHQPLHISFADDRGGNQIKPITGIYSSNPNLHSVWDSGVLSRARGSRDWWTFAGELRADITPQQHQQWSAIPMKDWAQESYDITRQAETQYCRQVTSQCEAITPNGRHLTASYQKTFGDVVELRLQKAGARLATLIEQALRP
jgi:nuclease S1